MLEGRQTSIRLLKPSSRGQRLLTALPAKAGAAVSTSSIRCPTGSLCCAAAQIRFSALPPVSRSAARSSLLRGSRPKTPRAMRRAGGTRVRRRHYGPAGATERLRRGVRRRAGRCGFSTAPRGPKSLPGDGGAGGVSIVPPGRWRGGRRLDSPSREMAGRAAAFISPPPLAGEAGRGPAAGQPGKARRVEGPSPGPSRRREGDDGQAAPRHSLPGDGGAGGASIVPPGRWRGGRRPLFLLPRLRGRPGGGQRPGSPARPVASRDPPPAPPASGRGDDGAGGASIVPPGR